MKIECDKSFMCWECDKMCNMKRIFTFPDYAFYRLVIDSTKSTAGMLIASGVDPKEANRVYNELVLTLITSRAKYLEELQKK